MRHTIINQAKFDDLPDRTKAQAVQYGARWLVPADLLVSANRIRGAGDLIAKIAQPIAKAIDRVARTKIANCGGCKRRQEKLNKLMPL